MTNETRWALDPSYCEIGFKVKHLMIANIRGTFKTFEAIVYTMGKDFTTAVIDFWADASSISTGDSYRDEHLRGKDFFDAEKYKQISFTSNSISQADPEGNHEMWGDLTMKGIKRRIKLNVQFGGILKDPSGNEKAGFTITGKINRLDWGISWNKPVEAGGLLVGEMVNILCEIELLNLTEKEFKLKYSGTQRHTV